MASATIDRESDVRTEHLTESQIAAFVDGDMTDTERRRIQSHIEQCSACRAAVVDVMRTVDSFPDVSSREPSCPPAQRRQPAPARSRRLLIGAVAAAAVAGISLLLSPTDRSRARERSASDAIEQSTDARPTIEVIAPLVDDSLSLRSPVFRWRAVAGIDLYKVVILDASGAPIWSEDARHVAHVVADSLSLVPGRAYYWRVDGIRDGTTASSGNIRFLAK